MNRRGYTFVELLLVLAVLAVLAGMAWPAVTRFSGEQAIKDGAERVRSELDRTRFRAIDAGLTYQFRYEPNGRRFIAIPAEFDIAPTAGGRGIQPAPSLPSMSGELSEGLKFLTGSTSVAAVEMLSPDWLAGLPDAGVLQQAQWSPPIYYRPDGTGTTATFRVVDEQARYVELLVRELTGMASTGPLRKEVGTWD